MGLLMVLTVGAVGTPEPVALPHTARTFKAVRSLEGGTATPLRFRGHREESGRVRLVPGYPGCRTCAENDIEQDPSIAREPYEDFFLPFDGPFRFYLPFRWRL
jgi:hypothetical protein